MQRVFFTEAKNKEKKTVFLYFVSYGYKVQSFPSSRRQNLMVGSQIEVYLRVPALQHLI